MRCTLLADSHHGLSEAVRGLLGTRFGVIVMVGDEPSMFEATARMQAELAVVDLSLPGGNGTRLVRRMRDRFPELALVVISVHAVPGVARAVLEAGADRFVPKSAIATDLVPAVDAALAGHGRAVNGSAGNDFDRRGG
jgi:two-component system secretion response regulator SsrB